MYTSKTERETQFNRHLLNTCCVKKDLKCAYITQHGWNAKLKWSRWIPHLHTIRCARTILKDVCTINNMKITHLAATITAETAKLKPTWLSYSAHCFHDVPGCFCIFWQPKILIIRMIVWTFQMISTIILNHPKPNKKLAYTTSPS